MNHEYHVDSATLTITDCEPEHYSNEIRKSFKIKAYISEKNRNKFCNVPIVISSIIITLIIISIVILSNPRDVQDTSNEKNTQKLILCGHNHFWSFNPCSGSLKILHRNQNPIGTTFDVLKEHSIFWVGVDAARIFYVNYESNKNVQNENLKIFFDESRSKLRSIAVDFLSGNLYAVENSTGALIVIDASSQKYGFLFTDLNDPLEIVLDPFEGIMFVLLRDEILRGNMDGSGSLESIVSKSNLASLTIDREKKRLYWVRDKLKIESSDYDGNHETTPLIDSEHLVSLAVVGDRLFWLWHRRIAYKSVEPILWSCSLTNESCSDHSVHTLDPPIDFDLIRSVSEPRSNASSPCRANRGGCQDMCLASPGGGRRCACRLGWRLNPDDRTCREVSEFALLVRGQKVRGLRLDSLRGEDVFWPTPFRAELAHKAAIHFDYDLRHDVFYFTDDTTIYRMRLKSSNWTGQTPVAVGGTAYLLDVAYDWLSGNLYCSAYRRNVADDEWTLWLMLLSARDPHLSKSLLKKISPGSSVDMQVSGKVPYLEGLAIDPIEGYLLFSAWQDDTQSIVRTSLNGTGELANVINQDGYFDTQLAIDYDEQRVYWICDSYRITHGKLDGSDLRDLYVPGVDAVLSGIAVYRHWIYLSTAANSMWRFRGSDGWTEQYALYDLAPVPQPSTRLKVVSAIFQVEEGVGCGEDNGGCEQFCFFAPTVTCECRDREIVQPDGHCLADY